MNVQMWVDNATVRWRLLTLSTAARNWKEMSRPSTMTLTTTSTTIWTRRRSTSTYWLMKPRNATNGVNPNYHARGNQYTSKSSATRDATKVVYLSCQVRGQFLHPKTTAKSRMMTVKLWNRNRPIMYSSMCRTTQSMRMTKTVKFRNEIKTLVRNTKHQYHDWDN